MLSKAQTILFTLDAFSMAVSKSVNGFCPGKFLISKRIKHILAAIGGQLIKGIVEPIFDEKADEFAKNLGMRIFSTNESGTTVLIIAPNFNSEKISDQLDLFHNKEGRSPFQALNFAAESILWYFWPKMVGKNQP